MSTRIRLAAFVATLCLAFPLIAQTDPIVEAPAGKVRGESKGTLRVFKGIPYAIAPVGTGRWKPTAAMPSWSGVRDATRPERCSIA